MTPTLTFDLETVPDIAGLRRLRPQWADLEDRALAEAAFAERREKTGSDFLPLHLHRIVAIGCAFRDEAGFRVRCLGSAADDEARLVRDFFRTIETHTPQLVSWNGGGFDLPVLHYRAMVHGVAAPRYWDTGDRDREFKFNNYLSRYHARHTDLMDVLALYQGRGGAPLDELARLCGYPGKLGFSGSEVWDVWSGGGIERIRAYCETDVVNTHLLWCRFERMRGHLDGEGLEREEAAVRIALAALPGEHWRQYLAAWDGTGT